MPATLGAISMNSEIVDLPELFKGFLQRTGVPALPLFKLRLADGVYESDLIPLAEIDSNPGFRATMLCIAARGKDSLMDESEKITV